MRQQASPPRAAREIRAGRAQDRTTHEEGRRDDGQEIPEPAQPGDFMAMSQGHARTVLYIHGIGNKPLPEVLRRQWDNALFGRGMGERTRMAYWVNRERYPSPEPGGIDDRDQGPMLNQSEQRILSALGVEPGMQDLGELADTLADSEGERALLHRMLGELEASAPPPGAPGAKGIASGLNRILLKMISAALLQDVHDFFFVAA